MCDLQFSQGEKREVAILNILGKMVYRKEVSSGTYQVNQRFAAGVHIVSLYPTKKTIAKNIYPK